MTKDLTSGRVGRVLLSFSLPLLLSTALQQFYNVADSMIVGRFAGTQALASVGAAYPITLFYIAIATGASMGCSVIVSQMFGAGKTERLRPTQFTVLLSFAVLGLVLSAVGTLGSGLIMRLLNAGEDIFRDARLYLAIYALGALPMLIYNACCGMFTGLGDSRTPLVLLFISSVLNVVLDYIAVKPLGWGVAGAAAATSLSQLVAALLSLRMLTRRLKALSGDRGRAFFDRAVLQEMTRAALPCILQQSCVALTHSIVQSLLNTFDTAIIAGYEAASKLHNFAYMSFNTIGTAFASFTAQCRGAGKHRRIWEGFRAAALMCFGCTLVVIALFQLIPVPLMGLFVEAEAEALVIRAGVNYLRIISPVYALICFIIVTGGLLRGVGKSFTFFVETLLEFAVRVTMCFVLTRALASYTGMMWAWYFGSSFGFLMCVGLSLHEYRKMKKGGLLS